MESGIGQGWAHKDIPVCNYTPLLSRNKCTPIIYTQVMGLDLPQHMNRRQPYTRLIVTV